nr:MAG TPA: hypothetical protein [Caudoviricetes sp.]
MLCCEKIQCHHSDTSPVFGFHRTGKSIRLLAFSGISVLLSLFIRFIFALSTRYSFFFLRFRMENRRKSKAGLKMVPRLAFPRHKS